MGMRAAIAGLSFAIAALVTCVSRAQAPLPPNARSIEMVDDGVIVYVAPDQASARRGTISLGTRAPAIKRVIGVGCGDGVFYQVGVDAFICAYDGRPSTAEPSGIPRPVLPAGELVPYEYRTVIADATPVYATPGDYDADLSSDGLQQDFVIAVREHLNYAGVPFVRSSRGDYLVDESLRPANPSAFVGVMLATSDSFDFAWTIRDRTPLRSAKNRHGSAVRHLDRHTLLRGLHDAGDGFWLLPDGNFVHEDDIARPSLSVPPTDLKPNERWIDVSVAEQVLVAYEGEVPVYATLVSSGLPSPQRATPTGTFSIWAKLAESPMNDLQRQDVDHHYSIEAVPWVQYFEGDTALHGAFWHNHFGTRVSHGCVNLAPRDALYLFHWTNPRLPAGWTAILPTANDPATRVRVR